MRFLAELHSAATRPTLAVSVQKLNCGEISETAGSANKIPPDPGRGFYLPYDVRLEHSAERMGLVRAFE